MLFHVRKIKANKYKEIVKEKIKTTSKKIYTSFPFKQRQQHSNAARVL